ncbi:MFS general substrate transporter [Marasmius fiardii PR-910]|nr:MFS general substrate transporter [Marasmius fiardii PR-910]
MPESIQLEIHPESASLDVPHATSRSTTAGQEVETGTTSATTDFIQSKSQINIARIQLAALFWNHFLTGWNDGSIGPLLPRIQEAYHVSDTVVSVIFILACIGYITGACLNIQLSTKYGFGKLLFFASTLQVIAYTFQSARLPFPVFVLAYTINGVGMAIEDAQCNGFIVALQKNPETKMGLLQGVYGFGAFAAPLVSTQFSQLDQWNFYYLCSLGIAIVNTVLTILVFRLKDQDVCLAEIGQPHAEPKQNQDENHGNFRQILSQRNVHLLASFLLVYVGVEVTIGGWIVTFIVRERNGGPDAGYISSGFFGGVALGSILLLWFNKTVGETRAMFIYFALAIGLELVVWLVPSLIGGALAVSFMGFLLGPVYPVTMNYAGRTLPRWILTGSVGWIAGFGQAGSAVFPFMTGALAGKYGINSLQPLLVAMMVAMTILWGVLCVSGRKKRE